MSAPSRRVDSSLESADTSVLLTADMIPLAASDPQTSGGSGKLRRSKSITGRGGATVGGGPAGRTLVVARAVSYIKLKDSTLFARASTGEAPSVRRRRQALAVLLSD